MIENQLLHAGEEFELTERPHDSLWASSSHVNEGPGFCLGIFLVFSGYFFGFLGLDGRECITVTGMGLTSRLHRFFFGYFFLVLPSLVLKTLHHSARPSCRTFVPG